MSRRWTGDVQFVGDYFVLRTTVTETEGMSEEQVIDKANERMKEHYGWDVFAACNEAEVEEWH